MRRFPASIVMMLIAAADAVAAGTGPEESFDRDARPFLRLHCERCHNADTQEGGLRLDDIGPIDAEGRFGNTWPEVQRRVIDGEMPPEGAPRPPETERLRFLDWVASDLQRARATYGATGGKVVLRRLNRSEYRETLRELLHLHPAIDTASMFPDDDTFHGFDTIGSALNVSPVQMRAYVENAARVLAVAFPTGSPPRQEKTHITALDAVDHYRASKRVQEWKRSTNGKVIPQSERNATQKTLMAAVPKVDGSRTIGFSTGAELEFLRDGIAFEGGGKVRWGGRPEGIYRFRFHVKGIANSQGDLPMLSVSLSAQPPHVDQQLLTTDMSDEFRTYEVEAYAQPHFQDLRFAVATMGNRFSYKRGEQPPRMVVQWVEIEGPIVSDWPSRAWHDYFAAASDDDDGARAILTRFAERAFRRPPDPDRVGQFFGFYASRRAAGDSFEAAVKLAMQGILSAPEFVFMLEPKSVGGQGRERLDDFELATRLAYFLWSGPPDDELYAVAKAGTLHEPKTLVEQARRMIAHPRAARFAENFTGQWLRLRSLGQMAPDPKKFVDWEETLQDSMRKETELFFLHVLQNDLPLTQLIDSDFAMLNGRLARFYGIKGVSGYEFRPVVLNGNPQRGGLLGQASIQTLTSDGLRTSPVKRGTFILENLLGDPPPPPPNDVPPVDETTGTTLRERLASHRSLPACASCHMKIDPLGFAMENFNAIGKWRENEEDTRLPIDPSGALAGGGEFSGFADFKRLLMSRKEDVIHCVAEKILLYALGRPLDFTDEPVIDDIVRTTTADGDRLSAVITAVVTSEPFLTK